MSDWAMGNQAAKTLSPSRHLSPKTQAARGWQGGAPQHSFPGSIVPWECPPALSPFPHPTHQTGPKELLPPSADSIPALPVPGPCAMPPPATPQPGHAFSTPDKPPTTVTPAPGDSAPHEGTRILPSTQTCPRLPHPPAAPRPWGWGTSRPPGQVSRPSPSVPPASQGHHVL